MKVFDLHNNQNEFFAFEVSNLELGRSGVCDVVETFPLWQHENAKSTLIGPLIRTIKLKIEAVEIHALGFCNLN